MPRIKEERTLREVLERSLRRHVPADAPVAVSLSGGVDSAILAAVCVRLGFAVRAWTFFMEGRASSDWRTAKKLARQLGVRHEAVPLMSPTLDDVRMLHGMGCRRKTAFECLHPRLHLIAAVEESCLVTGDGADAFFGTSKRAILHHRDPLEKFTAWQLSLLRDPDYAQRRMIRKLCNASGKVVVMPFSDPDAEPLFVGRSWQELNRPRNKEPLRRLADELGIRPISHHQNLQLGDSGISESFRDLAVRHGFRSAVGLFNAVGRGWNG